MADAPGDSPRPALKRLARELRRLRNELGLSQQEAARQAGYVREYITLAERGRQLPSPAMALRYSRVLGARRILMPLYEAARAEHEAIRHGQLEQRRRDAIASSARTALDPTVGSRPFPLGRPDHSIGEAALAPGALLLRAEWNPEDTEQLATSLDTRTPAPTASTVGRVAHEWLLADPPQIVEVLAGRRIGERLVAQIERRVGQLRRMDDFIGGGDLHALVERELHATVKLLDEAAYHEQLGRRLLAAVGELCQLAGWVAADAGLYGTAERYCVVGISAAHAAGDLPLGANLISTLSYQLANLGNPGEAAVLAHTAEQGARRVASAATRALLHERIAWAHARAGDLGRCERALGEVEHAFAQRQPESDPPWVYWLSQDEIQVMAGRCYTELQRPRRAEPLLGDVLDRYDQAHAREASLYASWLAEVHLQTKEVEKACAMATRSLILAARVNSARSADRVRHLRGRLGNYRDVLAVQEFEQLHQPLIADDPGGTDGSL